MLAVAHQGGRARRVALERVGQHGRQKRCFFSSEPLGALAEKVLRCCFRAIDPIAKLNHIEVYRHDALLTPERLYKESEVHLKSLSYPRASWPKEYVFGRLLANSAGSSQATPFAVVRYGCLYSVKIEAPMLQKCLVFRTDDGQLQSLGQGTKGHPLLFPTHRTLAVERLLYGPYHHERCNHHRHETVQKC